MPQAGTLTPPTENTPSSLRQVATAPNLRLGINRYANLDADSPVISVSPPPHQNPFPMKFYPLPSKYGQLSAFSLSTSPTKNMDLLHSDNKPSFTVGHDHDDSQDDYSGSFSKLSIPSTVIHTCDSPSATPRDTPAGSPSLLRRVLTSDPIQQNESKSTGFFGWLTRPSSRQSQVAEEATFFHQKEDMKSLQGLTKARLLTKPRPKMPVSMSDINVLTPSEY
ncbi:uncharacterized protein LOC129587688 [Paramacrobiotus metropolitanus]|uniref:uncharacterized protein LOC129587688 n=1 Tax=Paramacrobiotus metropolitanus TaxID=2943436 RepID=UPI002445A070|nr:uncharacterized protein LOC129587688 [Paramacrobiotus metropolitanus]XP_055337516.1 uncharacterized protein LOC129587688 [Paramacrobiotus metropolitanus]XP_055337517.1 uncharacterized protein LOC129587688 [Paramacrobiotus metropolitanus]